jgi:4-hydroxybenzoate polyprenyltransferase
MPWLRLIRWKNLLIVFLTQFLAWYCVLLPIGKHTGEDLLLDSLNFLLLSLSTVLIAAAGYIINDYFDVKIDIINRPEKMVLDKSIPRRHAIILHTVFNVIAIALALKLAREAGHYEWIWLQLVCSVLLWFYSTRYKRMFIIGNVVVALLTSFTILTLIIYEPVMHRYVFAEIFTRTSYSYLDINPVWFLGIYAYFAFILTWMREIVKDMEDFKGDAEDGCMTMPIKWGLQRSSWFTIGLGVLAAMPLLVAGISLLVTANYILGIYTLLALVLPLVVWMLLLSGKATTTHYANASRQLKILMLLGVGTLILNYLQEWLRSY